MEAVKRFADGQQKVEQRDASAEVLRMLLDAASVQTLMNLGTPLSLQVNGRTYVFSCKEEEDVRKRGDAARRADGKAAGAVEARGKLVGTHPEEPAAQESESGVGCIAVANSEYGAESCSGRIAAPKSAQRSEQAEIFRDTPQQPNGTMDGIVRYLEAHFMERISIDMLAEQFYISKYHLMRRFKQETGSTIHSFILERRIRYACRLLLENLSPSEVCYQAGFSDYSLFFKNFLKATGYKPSEYRLCSECPT